MLSPLYKMMEDKDYTLDETLMIPVMLQSINRPNNSVSQGHLTCNYIENGIENKRTGRKISSNSLYCYCS